MNGTGFLSIFAHSYTYDICILFISLHLNIVATCSMVLLLAKNFLTGNVAIILFGDLYDIRIFFVCITVFCL